MSIVAHGMATIGGDLVAAGAAAAHGGWVPRMTGSRSCDGWRGRVFLSGGGVWRSDCGDVGRGVAARGSGRGRWTSVVIAGRQLGRGEGKTSSMVASASVMEGRVVVKDARIDNELQRDSFQLETYLAPLKSGRLIDNLLYREKFAIRCYEVGTNRAASMETIANLLQEVACNHAQSVGFSTDGFATTPIMRQKHLIWVTTRMHIQMQEYPIWGDVVEIDTWYQGEGRIETRRDWIIRNDKTGDIIGRATSTWVMMNMDTRRLSRIPDDVRQEYMPFVPVPPRWAFDPKEEKNSSIKKIGRPGVAQFECSNLMPRRNDLDMNQHVNNVTYVCWMLEAIPPEVPNNYELTQITLDYKRECKSDDIVESLVIPENTVTGETISWLLESKCATGTSNGSYNSVGSNGNYSPEPKHSTLLFVHVLRLTNEGKEINRGRTEWRRKSNPRGSH
ncbi:oleoyl-acyl carrier protein thioesterase 1, chloroplastic [Physcomitrium patens]|uniref:Acyl-[acyl-carrier-protein] hydrolase n=2 Tax=Physcomitrium patens TaxID=3218 RepID=A0A7I4B4Q7_PHYPA|nr:oleoyl-acyl carrier protein thioesterase 1, chloroplastic-like isoform X1 [Physcomitrium patens]|eukprot:XP_024397914.1 oleoyl-acyl carrier protein thioesterase 1, chloroplastic-like isoform X1 [Physcomitrella patens]